MKLGNAFKLETLLLSSLSSLPHAAHKLILSGPTKVAKVFALSNNK